MGQLSHHALGLAPGPGEWGPLGSGGGRSLRVCIASLAPFVGGAEVAAERLALGLLAAGHDVLVVLGTRGPVLERMERSGLRCVHSPMCLTDKWHWWRYMKARNRLRQAREAVSSRRDPWQ